ncbi:hypothetical protein [Sinomicrobium sp.]
MFNCSTLDVHSERNLASSSTLQLLPSDEGRWHTGGVTEGLKAQTIPISQILGATPETQAVKTFPTALRLGTSLRLLLASNLMF